MVYKAYIAGRYVIYDPAIHDQYLSGRAIRFGTYGDPMAAPFELWENLKSLASVTTGYTHQWRKADSRFASLCMASADTVGDVEAARMRGYRSFRVGDSKIKGEVLCPASEAAGKKLQCIDCGSCAGGTRRGSIYIPLHGGTATMANKSKLESRIIARAAA